MFIVKRAKEKQLDILLEFISCIHECKNYFCFFEANNNEPTGSIVSPVSIFDLIRIYNKEGSKWDIDEESIFFIDPSIGSDLLEWNFYFKYINHPLLPLPIVNVLKRFCLLEMKDINYTMSKPENKNFVCLRGKGHVDYRNGYTVLFEDIINKCEGTSVHLFFDNCMALKCSIEKWLKSNGVKDVNLYNK